MKKAFTFQFRKKEIMKKLMPYMLLLVLTACGTTKIYLVRHAEKAVGGDDPGLTAEGKQRAEALKNLLHGDSLNGAYATQYQRTFETAQPTVIDQRITLRRYPADTGKPLLDSLTRLKKKQFLIVGHSNTLLPMLTGIGLHPGLKEIKDTDYDNLFIVTVRWFLGRHVRLKETVYGKKTL